MTECGTSAGDGSGPKTRYHLLTTDGGIVADQPGKAAGGAAIGVVLKAPLACGFPVRGAKDPTDALGTGLPIHAVAGFFSASNLVGGDGNATIFGVAAHEVAAVRVELRDGRVVDAPLYDAPQDLRADVEFFIVRLSVGGVGPGKGSPVRAYSAYDRNGNLVERVDD